MMQQRYTTIIISYSNESTVAMEDRRQENATTSGNDEAVQFDSCRVVDLHELNKGCVEVPNSHAIDRYPQAFEN